MIKSSPIRALTLAVLMASSAAAAAVSTAHAQHPAAHSALNRWAQETSDLAPDPQIRFGRLPNGMRYVLMRNATPSGQASFRLRLNAGSMMESDAQQGLAHFLEHMAFNGSTGVPRGEMVKILERHGLAFGADTNASTSWNETVYKLDLPRTDADTVDTSLMLLREVAGNLLLDQGAMDHERGVVLSEERQSDTPGYRASKDRIDAFLSGQLAAARMPIGKVEVVRGASRDLIADIYDKYYRPERATFVAVGDFDLDAMEAKIKARFSDWHNDHPAGAEPDVGRVLQRGLQTRVDVVPGAPLSIELGWISPPDLAPDTRAKRQRQFIERLGLAVLDRRLERIARTQGAPFLSADSGRGEELHSAQVTTLQISADPDGWRKGLDAAVGEQRRLVRYGVLQSELDREIGEVRVALQQQVDSASTRATPQLAAGIVGAVDQQLVVLSPAQELALFEQTVKGLTAQTVSQAVAKVFDGQGPVVFMNTPKPIDGGEMALASALRDADAAPVLPPVVQADKTWPYDHFGPPGVVAQRREVADLGVTLVRFANGVRLTVKPTTFRKDQILVQVRFGDGRLDLSKTLASASWARGAFIEGGLKALTAEQLDQVMTSKIAGASLDLDDDAFALQGATRPADLGVQLQLLTAYMVEPGFRPEAFDRMRTYGATLHDQLEATPNGVVSRDLATLMHGGDQRWSFPTRQAIADSRPQDLQALLADPLARGQVEVIIVGDVTVDQAIAATASTLGALHRPAATAPAADARKIAFPAPALQPIVEHHKGRADLAVAVAAWPTTDFFADPQEARTLRVMVEVMRLRLIDDLRIAQGATYSPGVGLDSSFVFPGYGYVSASVQIPPAKVDGFFTTVNKIAADLKTQDATPDELTRATLPRIEALQKTRETNEFWLDALANGQTNPGSLDAIRTQIPQMKAVTAADVRKVAQKYLLADKAWNFEVLPTAP